MDAFLLTLILTFAIAFGGRDQMIIAQFSDATGRPVELLVLGMACAAATGTVMALAGWQIAALLPDRAANMLVAIALVIAAFELAWPVRLRAMKEPTRSYVAIATVLVFRQLLDAARFLIFAFAAQAIYPAVTIIGGALGGMAAIALGWVTGQRRLDAFPLYYLRVAMAACSIVAGLFIGLGTRFSAL